MDITKPDVRGPALPLGDRVSAARQTLVELSDMDRLARLDDQDLLSTLKELESLGRLVDAGRAFAAGEVHQRSRKELGDRRLCVKKGFTKAADLVADTTGTSTGAAHRRIAQAQPLQPAVSTSGREEPSRFPLTQTCVRAGLVSTEASSLVTDVLRVALDRGAAPARVADAELALIAALLGARGIEQNSFTLGSWVPQLLDEARETTPGRGKTIAQVKRVASAWKVLLVQEADRARGEEGERLRAAEKARIEGHRHLRILPLKDGTRRLEGQLLPEVAAQFELILDSYMNPRVDGSRHGDVGPSQEGSNLAYTGEGVTPAAGTGTEPGTDFRTRGQKIHDAFGGLLSVAAGVPGMPLMGGAPPTLVVTVEESQLGRPTGVAHLVGTHDEADAAVDATTAQHTGCSGQIQTMVTNRGGGIVELGSPSRIFTHHQRRAIAVRDGGCCIPGCEVPATWCEVHHVHEHARGGVTHTDNGVTLCWHHHRQPHVLGWDIQMREGAPGVRPPASVDPGRAWRPAQTGAPGHLRELVRTHGTPEEVGMRRSGGTTQSRGAVMRADTHLSGTPGRRPPPDPVPPDDTEEATPVSGPPERPGRSASSPQNSNGRSASRPQSLTGRSAPPPGRSTGRSTPVRAVRVHPDVVGTSPPLDLGALRLPPRMSEVTEERDVGEVTRNPGPPLLPPSESHPPPGGSGDSEVCPHPSPSEECAPVVTPEVQTGFDMDEVLSLRV